MARAVNRMVELQGGLVVADNGGILVEFPLPVGGSAPLGTIEETVQGFKRVEQSLKQLGCSLADPFLTLQTIPGTSLPFFRITLQGFVDLRNKKAVDLIVE